MSISDDQSYTLILRDVLFAKVAVLPPFATFTKRRTKMVPVQPHLLPYLGVYIIDESMVPDGDFNAGNIRFNHTARIGFSVIMANNDQVVLETKLDAAFWSIMNGVWKDPWLTNMLDTTRYGQTHPSNPDNTRLEGVTRGSRKHVFGNAGLNNEMPIGEMQYDVSIFYRTIFAPVITDDLLMIHVETAFPSGGTPDEIAAVQQVIAKYEFTPIGTDSVALVAVEQRDSAAFSGST